MLRSYACFALAVLVFVASSWGSAEAVERAPIVIDTDIGTDVNDAFALGLALGSSEVDLRGVTTVGADSRQRAMMVCRFLTMTGRRSTPVAVGENPQPSRPITDQEKYYYHPDALFDRTTKPVAETATDFLLQRLRQQPGKVSLVALGPLTNVARLLDGHADRAPLIQRVVLLESNIALDVDAARKVFGSGVQLVVISSSVGQELKLNDANVKRVFSPGTPLSRQVEAMYQMWDRQNPALDEALAVALCFEDRWAEFLNGAWDVNEKGGLRERSATANARVVSRLKSQEFIDWYTDRMASLVAPRNKPSRLIRDEKLPHRVHVAEDFDSDIERRWWMSGKPESKLLPMGSKRACRGVLTHDFDDLLMPSRQMYTAVIFNPVPGPPMGKNTRLRFRYWLKGTDTIRVQIYSLTNGYHRQLVVKDLPQGKWEQATVNMTDARRPDGTGGPLSENERIDDIQFYIEPDAEIIIDDIVLYDAASEGENRPFPKRIIFAGGFDTGQRGREWPGDFELVADAGNFWRAVRPLPTTAAGEEKMHVGLRGMRTLGDKTHVSFRYRLEGADRLQLRLVNSTANKSQSAEVGAIEQGVWGHASIDLNTSRVSSVDEIHVVAPAGAKVLMDDLLLSESATDR